MQLCNELYIIVFRITFYKFEYLQRCIAYEYVFTFHMFSTSTQNKIIILESETYFEHLTK